MQSIKSSSPTSSLRLVWCLVAISAIAVIYIGCWSLNPTLPAGNNGHDLIFLADGARFIGHGRWPHVDFSLPVGSLSYVLYWLGGKLLPLIPAYPAMHLLFFVLISPILLAAALALPVWWARLALIAMVSGAVLLPFNTTTSGFCGIELHASYNRFGAGLSLAYLAWLFRAGKSRWLDTAILTWVVLVAVFLKIVYLAVILAPLGILFLFEARWRWIALQALAAVLAILGLIEVATGQVTAYIHDILAMTSVNSGRVIYFLFSFGYKHFIELSLAAALILLVLWNGISKAGDRAARLATLKLPLAMAASIFGIMVAESQSTGGLGVTPILGLLVIPSLFASAMPRAQMIAGTSLAALVGGGFVIANFEKSLCVLLQRQGQLQQEAWAERFFPEMAIPESLNQQARLIADLWTGAAPVAQGDWYRLSSHFSDLSSVLYLAEWITVDEAIGELERRGLIKGLGRVTTLSFVDQFGFALDAEPADGGKNVIDVGRTLFIANTAQARNYLAGVDTVFAPSCAIGLPPQHDRDEPWLTDAFAEVLEAEFSAEPITPCWTMHRRL